MTFEPKPLFYSRVPGFVEAAARMKLDVREYTGLEMLCGGCVILRGVLVGCLLVMAGPGWAQAGGGAATGQDVSGEG